MLNTGADGKLNQHNVHKNHSTYEELQELEDPLVREDIKCIPTDRVSNRQAVNLVLD